ncbi:DUF6153 family protein [Streptomyces sp. NPDC097610]|uniref:DUF6153 family protein n=1 Tax=Streptomyces sp. NPDC097610 TaxID=3157227 RepID=UPI00331BC7CA
MTSPQQHPPRPPVGRWRALLVLGVLAGLLGMHALAPGGLHTHQHERVEPQHMTAVVSTPDGCSGDGDCGGGHLQHADSTCASGAVTGGPALPALVPDPMAIPVRADTVCSYAAAAPDSARAPPSLAELQLLRI